MKKKDTPTSRRISNWKEYSQGLKRRGSLTVWIEAETEDKWLSKSTSGKRGAHFQYSDFAIELFVQLQGVFGLAGRQTEGFLGSVFSLLNINLPVPEHSTVSRRMRRLLISPVVKPLSGACHLVIDASGLKVAGEGEWKVKKHGKERRRTWRKLHISVDEDTGEIISHVLTNGDVHDSQTLEDILNQAKKYRSSVVQVTGDGAFDQKRCYDAIEDICDAYAVIPPKENAILSSERDNPKKPYSRSRDHTIKQVRKLGYVQWKKDYGYHRRSLAETAFSRLKKAFPVNLRRKNSQNQQVEISSKINILNQMNYIATPTYT